MEQRKAERRAELSRRGFLANAGKVAVGATVGAAGLSALAASQAAPSQAAAELPAYPWTYKTLDPEAVYWKANALYYKSACCQAAFEAIISELGFPFNTVPVGMMRYGEGGVVGWGSHCGALNGSSAAINLAFPDAYAKLITELTGWYTEQLGSGSPLCHISVTEWAKAHGVVVDSQERKDRCARVAGETAKKAVLLMNAQAAGEFKATFAPKTTTTGCLSCHGASGRQDVRPSVAQDCAACHGNVHQQ